MRYRLLICAALILFVAACQGPPPTQIVLVVTATPSPEVEETEAVANTADVQQATEETVDLPSATVPQATPTLDLFPTPTISQIQVAEQVFEHGRLMWIQPRSQIWVMIDDGTGKGTWSIFEDTFVEGETEFDPSIVPPEGMYQPERGFGKLWRENQTVHDALGWGLTPEFGYVSNYEYHPGGRVEQNEYIQGPGYHILFSMSQEKFQFNEADYTWKKL